MSETQYCPCGTQISPSQCCLPVIQGSRKADTAEALLRARYTAFTRGEIDFILDTHHPRTREEIKRDEVEEWSRNSEWLGLELLKSEKGQPTDTEGLIEFHAQYRTNGELKDHWEQSYFEKEEGEWKFVDARNLKPDPIRRTEPKIGRNDPCACGSGKKFKKCCG